MAKRKPVKELEVELSQALERHTRAVADYQNLERRVEDEREVMSLKAKEQILQVLLPVFDNFNRLVECRPEIAKNLTENEIKKIVSYLDGLILVKNQLEKTLSEVGLKKIPTKGMVFDHNLHEAISYESSQSIKADYIIDEVESGWIINQTVLKPAKVRVSQGE